MKLEKVDSTQISVDEKRAFTKYNEARKPMLPVDSRAAIAMMSK